MLTVIISNYSKLYHNYNLFQNNRDYTIYVIMHDILYTLRFHLYYYTLLYSVSHSNLDTETPRKQCTLEKNASNKSYRAWRGLSDEPLTPRVRGLPRAEQGPKSLVIRTTLDRLQHSTNRRPRNSQPPLHPTSADMRTQMDHAQHPEKSGTATVLKPISLSLTT